MYIVVIISNPILLKNYFDLLLVPTPLNFVELGVNVLIKQEYIDML